MYKYLNHIELNRSGFDSIFCFNPNHQINNVVTITQKVFNLTDWYYLSQLTTICGGWSKIHYISTLRKAETQSRCLSGETHRTRNEAQKGEHKCNWQNGVSTNPKVIWDKNFNPLTHHVIHRHICIWTNQLYVNQCTEIFGRSIYINQIICREISTNQMQSIWSVNS